MLFLKKLHNTFRCNIALALDPSERESFKESAKALKLKTGQLIFEEGDSAGFVCLIDAGHAKVFRSSPLGDVVTVAIRKAGDLIGVAEVLSDTSRLCSAECLDNCELWKMDSRTFVKMLHSTGSLAVKVATSMGTRLREAETTIMNLVTLEVDRRLARLLISLAEKGLTPGEEGMRIDMRLKHSELAEMVGTCRQTVTTTLQKFKSQGYVVTGKERIEIIDMEGLKDFAGL